MLGSMAMAHIDVGRHRRFQMWQLGLHIIDGLDNVGPRLAEQGDEDSGSSVGPTKVAHILDGILHVGHIRQSHRGAVAVGDDQRRIICSHNCLIVRVDLKAPVAVINRALRAIGISCGKRSAHVLEADAVFVERLRVELDANGKR